MNGPTARAAARAAGLHVDLVQSSCVMRQTMKFPTGLWREAPKGLQPVGELHSRRRISRY